MLLTGCASAVRDFAPIALDSAPVKFTNGRVQLYVTDEYGLPMARTRVEFSWETPQYYKTTALTDGAGRVTFSGVPEVAEISIDHFGGNYTRLLLVPQRGTSELWVTLDTYGENKAAQERLQIPLDQQPRRGLQGQN